MTIDTKVPARFGGEIRRVTDLQVQEGEEGWIAVELATTGRVGVFEGVHIDFTHADLPADEWWARPWWHVFGDGEQHCGLVFPGEAGAPAEDWERAKSDVERPAIHAKAGDKVTISRLQQTDGVSFLHHPHDYSVRKAFLTLTRPDGSTVEDIGPLAFYGKTRIRGQGSREAFDNAIARIADIDPAGLRWPDLFDANRRPSWDNGPDTVAKYHAAEAHDGLFELLDTLAPDDHRSYVQLRSLVNSAMLAGFALAKYEAQRAEKWEAARKASAQKGAAATRNDDWREAAKVIWRSEPALTTNAVARRLVGDQFNDIEVSSMSRAIRNLAPPASSSHKAETFEAWT